jgi:hypothetical protein
MVVGAVLVMMGMETVVYMDKVASAAELVVVVDTVMIVVETVLVMAKMILDAADLVVV